MSKDQTVVLMLTPEAADIVLDENEHHMLEASVAGYGGELRHLADQTFTVVGVDTRRQQALCDYLLKRHNGTVLAAYVKPAAQPAATQAST